MKRTHPTTLIVSAIVGVVVGYLGDLAVVT